MGSLTGLKRHAVSDPLKLRLSLHDSFAPDGFLFTWTAAGIECFLSLSAPPGHVFLFDPFPYQREESHGLSGGHDGAAAQVDDVAHHLHRGNHTRGYNDPPIFRIT
jgi:hypothetical protein